MKNSIVNSIASLPPLSKTISEIEKVCADESAGVIDLANVLQQDPMMVANLLKAANSPLYGFAKEIKNISQAVSLFGMKITQSIVTGNVIKKLLNVDMQPYGITSEKFATISCFQAELLMQWYKTIDKSIAEELYLVALLQESGKILIANDVLKNDEDISFRSEIEMSNNISEVEKSYVSSTTAEVSAAIFEHWKFDEKFIETMRASDDDSSLLNIVKTVVCVNKPFSEISINIGLQKAEKAGYDLDKLQDAIDRLKEVF